MFSGVADDSGTLEAWLKTDVAQPDASIAATTDIAIAGRRARIMVSSCLVTLGWSERW